MIDLARMEQYRENNRIEAKKALGGLPHSIWETYSAFANTLGGLLLLGVEEHADKSLHTVDLPDPERLVREFWALVNDPKKASVNILSEDDVRVEEAGGDHIVVISVPRAARFDRPVYVDGDPLHGSYRRSGEGDYRCSAEEVEAMQRDAALLTQDMRLLEKLEPDVLSAESLDRYRDRLRALRPGHVWETLPDAVFLEKLGAAAPGRDGRLHPTAAGLLMFGRTAEIRRVYPRFSLRYRSGGNAEGETGENVHDFFFHTEARLAASLPDAPAPVRKAVGEALGNCLINADYYGRYGVEVTRRRDAIVLTNPGDFRIGLDAARAGGRSDPRNGYLMKMFNLLDVGESAGGGIPGIFRVWQEQGWGEPALVQTVGPGAVTLTLPLGPQRAHIGRKTGDRAAIRKAARREQAIQYLTDHASAGAEELSAVLGIRPSGAERILRALAAEGIAAAEGRGAEKIYRLKA